MRFVWCGFLVSGLLLIGVSALERKQRPEERAAPPCVTNEDGTPMPHPYPTPRPKTQ
jgi:hypothetical protein